MNDLTQVVAEFETRPPQSLGLKDPKLLNKLKPTGREIEGFSLHALQVNDEIIFALANNEELLTVLIGSIIEDFPDAGSLKTIKVSRSWTPEHQRNRGYSTALYDGLPRNGYRVVSDEQLSSTALSVWKKLATKRTLKAFDWETGMLTDKDPTQQSRVSFVFEYTGRPITKIAYCMNENYSQ